MNEICCYQIFVRILHLGLIGSSCYHFEAKYSKLVIRMLFELDVNGKIYWVWIINVELKWVNNDFFTNYG